MLKIILKKTVFLKLSDFFLGMSACFNCNNCFNSNPAKLEELFKIAVNQGRKPFLIMILNIILNIEKTYSYYCFCKNKRQCLICATASSFKDVQYGLYQHSLDFNQSNLIVVDLHLALKEILPENNHFVCSVINNKFYYSCDNWFSGKKTVFTIEQCLSKWENTIDHLKKTCNRNQFKKNMDKLLSIYGFFKVMLDEGYDF